MKSQARKELEAEVAAFDKTWKGKMDNMPIMQVLSKCHPLYRVDNARKLEKAGDITEDELKSFLGKAAFKTPTMAGDWV